jgi:hypothetical protein
MKKYSYRNKKTGRLVHSDKLLHDSDLVLVRQVRDGQMKGHNIHQT